ncbi:unnamed protein product, partial [Iphiclides podalirius]
MGWRAAVHRAAADSPPSWNRKKMSAGHSNKIRELIYSDIPDMGKCYRRAHGDICRLRARRDICSGGPERVRTGRSRRGIPARRDTATPRHRDTASPRHRDTATPRHRDTATPRNRADAAHAGPQRRPYIRARGHCNAALCPRRLIKASAATIAPLFRAHRSRLT